MWKFQFFSVSQVLCEIKVNDFRGPKNAILTHLEALDFDFHEFVHFQKAEIYLNQKFRAPKIVKIALFAILHSPKLISRKI